MILMDLFRHIPGNTTSQKEISTPRQQDPALRVWTVNRYPQVCSDN